MDPFQRLVAVMFVLVALSVGGCRTVNSSERAESQASPEFVDDKRVSTDPSAKASANIISINETRLPSGLLKVQAEIYNKTRVKRTVNYRFEWVRQDGMAAQGLTSGWKSVRLFGKERKLISATATDPEAVDFRLKIVDNRDEGR